MNPDQFLKSAPGRLVLIPEGVQSFIPKPPPASLSFTTDTIKLLSNADISLGRLQGVAQTLPNPQLLVRAFLRREAELSSRIEGTFASQRELVLFDITKTLEENRPDVREVANYVHALEHGLKRLAEIPTCLRLIKELHVRLLEGVRGGTQRPGHFRQIQNFIGQRNRPIGEARFVPPPPSKIPECLDSFERSLHAENDLPALVHIAVIHYQFEAIHPFEDGNGRIGRLLLPLLLCERKLLSHPLLNLSAYFEKRRDEYYDQLLNVSQKGDWENWIRFFLRGIAEQAQEAAERSKQLLDLRQHFQEVIRTKRASALAARLVDSLFHSPGLTVPLAQRLLKVTYPSANLAVQKLVEAKILFEVSGYKRNRVWMAPQIVNILSNPSGNQAAQEKISS